MKLGLIATAIATNFAAITAAIALDANLPAYQAVGGISGQIKSVGSDTLDNEMALWAKGFEGQYPGVKIEIEGKGSAMAPPALLEGASQFGPMSRPMNADVSTAAQKCARWRRKGVPVWLREKGLESLACLFVAARIEALGA
jgi:phosphate transport system substrate-binding protein